MQQQQKKQQIIQSEIPSFGIINCIRSPKRLATLNNILNILVWKERASTITNT